MQKGKKRRKREPGAVFKGKWCAKGACMGRGVHSITLAKGAVHTVPPGQKLFHQHPGMARKAGHVLHSLSMELCSRRDSRSLVLQEHCGWSLTGRAVTSRPINSPTQPCHPGLQPRWCPLFSPRRCQPFPAPGYQPSPLCAKPQPK